MANVEYYFESPVPPHSFPWNSPGTIPLLARLSNPPNVPQPRWLSARLPASTPPCAHGFFFICPPSFLPLVNFLEVWISGRLCLPSLIKRHRLSTVPYFAFISMRFGPCKELTLAGSARPFFNALDALLRIFLSSPWKIPVVVHLLLSLLFVTSYECFSFLAFR